MTTQMEVICVGNELLIGKTLNTNAYWIAKRATSLGVIVKRITIVSDDVDEIAHSLLEALARKPRFIVTTGGLGPTFDDITFEGIAKGLDRRLQINTKALQMIKEKYATFHREEKTENAELTPPRIKMATLPEETEPLFNPVGTAPGMMAALKDTFLIALPGVPPEMEAIFDTSVAPMLRKEAGKSAFFEVSIFARNIMESNLAPLIDRAMHDNPYVYIKSHVFVKSLPKTEGQKAQIELHFSTTTENHGIAKERLGKAVIQLSDLIERSGGKVGMQSKKGTRSSQ